MKKKRKQHGRFSMKWSLIAIICICWILPIVVILLVSSNMITGNLETQIVKMVDGSAEYAVDLTQSRVENVFAASRKPSYDPKFREMYLRYKEDGDIISYYSDMSDYIAIQYRYDEHFYTTMVYLTDEPENLYFVLNNDITGAAFKVLNYKEHIHAEVQEIAKSMGTEIRLHETEYGLFLVRNIMDSSYRPYAVIVQELNTDKILQNMGTIPWLEALTVTMDNIEREAMGLKKATPAAADLGHYIRETNLYSTRIERNIEGHRLYFTMTADGSRLLSEMPNFNTIALLMLLLSVPLLALVIAMFYRHVTSPINKLIAASSRVEQGEMGFELEDLPATSEFLQLTEHFNSMSRRLKQQFERIYMEQSALQDSRIRALQSQINPHFLNNTLEIINWEARMSNSEKVSKMIEALSTMLNAAMARDERPTVTLEEELSYVESYLYIISVRYGRRLSVHKEIDETLYDNEVPRLIMQPIVENAIDHGVAVNRSGEIWLRIYKKGQSLVMEVENNQPLQKRDEEAIAGLLAWPTEEARAEEGKASIGIRNVNARLKILYGPAYGLSIAASETGTLATILVPLDPEAEFSGGTPAE